LRILDSCSWIALGYSPFFKKGVHIHFNTLAVAVITLNVPWLLAIERDNCPQETAVRHVRISDKAKDKHDRIDLMLCMDQSGRILVFDWWEISHVALHEKRLLRESATTTLSHSLLCLEIS
jgi:hypothetical protein